MSLERMLLAIKERAEKATPGPWGPCIGSGNNECTAISFEGNEQHPYGLLVCDLVPDWALDDKYRADLEYKPANMDFIINARTDIPKLLAVIAKLREQRDWWLGECCERYGAEDMNKYIAQDDAKLEAILNGEAK